MSGNHLWGKYKPDKKPKELEVYRGPDDSQEVMKRQEDYDWFKLNADERLETINERIEDLEELRKTATNTADCVRISLPSKQS